MGMKIYWNIVIQPVTAFSLQNNAWRDKQASLAPHSCQDAFAFLQIKPVSILPVWSLPQSLLRVMTVNKLNI